ncbi:DUF5777 family beta-barrel protein [soil metagenome]
MKKIILFSFISMLGAAKLAAQDSTDLMSMLEKEQKKTTNYTIATFKSSRIINGHSVENIGKAVLDVRILHRFTPISGGIYQLFGLDGAYMRLGFDYGISNRVMVGIGHTTYAKTYDGFIKIKLLRQSTGVINMPVTMSLLSTINIRSDLARYDAFRNAAGQGYRRVHPSFGDRTTFVEQLIIGRKFSKRLSLQIMPTYIINHNRVDTINKYTVDRDSIQYGPYAKRKNSFAIGIGGRLKITKRLSLTAEYYYLLPNDKPANIHNSLSLGIDIETGGHVFQLHFTNATAMTESFAIPSTPDKFYGKNIRFGFNLSRVFNIGKHK